jgi:DNA-binding winged helix-turn-helix (wHTH) protein
MLFRFTVSGSSLYELDEEAGELRRDGVPVAIQPKPFALLLHLIRERERVVSLDELYERLWPDVAVTPSSLTRAVSVARSAIGDTGRGEAIKSVARRGYRFSANVVAIAAADAKDAAAAPAESARSRPGDAARALFVGREDALATLREAWREAATGHGAVALVTGPPGIGKTRLAEVFAAEAARGGARVLTGRAREGEGVPALWLWTEAVRDLAPGADGALARLASGAEPALAEGESERSPEQSRFLLFDGVARALVAASRERPIAIVLEDLQWAGTASLRLLEHLCFEIEGAPLLVVGTVRDETRARGHPLDRTVATLRQQARCVEVALRGFSRREVGQLVERTIGRPAPPDLTSELVARTEGVPLLLREALRLLAERGDLRQPEGVRRWAVSLPAHALDLIRRPLERLSPPCAELLAAGAVLGREWPLALAAAVAGVARDAALDLADEAEAAGVVEPAAGTAATWRFSHALFQEAVYGALPAGRRARLHARAAEELERRFGAQDERAIAELAHHHHESLAVGDPERAYATALRAAALARRLCAFEQVAAHCAQALDALDHAEPVDAERRLATLLELGEALRLAGDRPRRRSVCEEAMAAARALGRPLDFARAAISFCDLTEWAPRDAEAGAALEAALELLGEETSSERARVLSRLAYLGARRTDVESEATARRAVEAARAAGDPEALQEALYVLGFLIAGPDRLEERGGLEREIVASARRSASRDPALVTLVDVASDRLALGDAAGARRARAEAAEIAGPSPHLGMLWHLRAYDAGLALLEGRIDDAEPLVDEARAIGVRIEHPFARGVHLVQRAEIWRERGAWQEIVDGVDPARATTWMRAMAGRAHAALGRTEEARALLDGIAAKSFEAIHRNVRWVKNMVEIAGLAVDLRAEERARALIALLAPYASLHAVLPVPICYGGPVAHALARLHEMLGDRTSAGELYGEALAAAESLGARPAAERIRSDQAALAARGGRARGER